MDEFMSIGEVARVLGVPTSKLRYWEREGLLRFDRDEENNYRRFSFTTLNDVADVMFAREVGMPIKDLQDLHQKSAREYVETLDDLEEAAMEEIGRLRRTIRTINTRRDSIREWLELKEQGIHIERARLQPVYEFDYSDEEKVRLYVEDPTQAVDIIPPDGSKDYQYGRFMDDAAWQVLRPGDRMAQEYLVGPVWLDDKRDTNILELADAARRLGYEPGYAICRFLCAGHREGDGYSYFMKAYMELERP